MGCFARYHNASKSRVDTLIHEIDGTCIKGVRCHTNEQISHDRGLFNITVNVERHTRIV